jgi:hypothetical protein
VRHQVEWQLGSGNIRRQEVVVAGGVLADWRGGITINTAVVAIYRDRCREFCVMVGS